MGFSEWIHAQGYTHSYIADQLGVSAPFVTMLIHGQRTPSLATLKKITTLTRGEVGIEDFSV
jgi:transcriptional regulator with XRE-family HTH domain